MSRLASSRFRRRAGWLGALVAVAGAVALVVVSSATPGIRFRERFEAGKPQVVPPAPEARRLHGGRAARVRAVAARFVESAVYRRHVDDSGRSRPPASTRASPARTGRAARSRSSLQRRGRRGGALELDYSYAKDVALKVAFYPKPGSGAARQIFEIELENHGTDATPNWLVSYWAPSGGPQLQDVQPGGGRRHPSSAAGGASSARSGSSLRSD